MRNVLNDLKKGLKKKVVCGLAASIVYLLMSCTQPKAVLVQEKITPVPVLQIDTCFVYKRDTIFRIDTDTFLIETIIRDTLISQHIETKPFFIRSTDTVFINTTSEQKSEVKQAKKERNMAAILLVFVCLLLFFLAKSKN